MNITGFCAEVVYCEGIRTVVCRHPIGAVLRVRESDTALCLRSVLGVVRDK